MRRVLVAIASLAACGRWDFDARRDAAGGEGAVDAGITGRSHYLKASNTNAGDAFGNTLALSADGMTLAISAFGESSAATGINGNQADNSASAAGAVYVFGRTGDTWTQQAYLKTSNDQAGDELGSVVISADGNTLVAGSLHEASAATGVGGNQADNSAPQSGAAYVFVRTGTTWTQQAYLKASNTGAGDLLGWSMGLSADGNTFAIGAYQEDSAATGINGNQADNSATDSGAVYVFVRTGAGWVQQAYLKASNTDAGDHFGNSLALSGDGQTLAVSSGSEASAATGIDGNQADNSAPGAGAVYVFTFAGGVWSQQAYLKGSNTEAGDIFGTVATLSQDGNTLGVGAVAEDSAAIGIGGNQADNSATDSGATYVFTRTGAIWAQEAYLKASNTDAGDWFGYNVAVTPDGNSLAVSAVKEDSAATGLDGNQADNSAVDSGAVYLFARAGGTWVQRGYLKASNTGAGDVFGHAPNAFTADGGMLVVGAYLEDSAATGIDGDGTDNSATNSGAVYVFQ